MNVFARLSMFPLQSEWWLTQDNQNTEAQYFAISIGILVVILVILNMVKNKFRPKMSETSTASKGPRLFSSFTLHRLTGDLGLDRDQVKMLDFVMKSGGVTDPERFLNSPTLLDRYFKRAYRLIERSTSNNEDLNERLAILFSTRNIIESNVKDFSATSTRQIPEKIPSVITIDKVNYPVQVISSRGDTLIVENPKKSAGVLLHPPRGSRASLSFVTKSNKGFLVETRILDVTEDEGIPVLKLAHSGQLKKLSARRFRRRQTIIDTAFYYVFTDSRSKKSIVDKKRCAGKIMDISIGGCSVKTTIPVSSGQRIKLEFTHSDSSTIAALGEVLRSSRTGIYTVLHIKFLKVPRKSLNSINAMVYEYT